MSNYDKAFALGDPPNYRPDPEFFLVARSGRLSVSVSVAEPDYKLPAGRHPKALLLNPRRTSPAAVSKQCALRNDLRLKLPTTMLAFRTRDRASGRMPLASAVNRLTQAADGYEAIIVTGR